MKALPSHLALLVASAAWLPAAGCGSAAPAPAPPPPPKVSVAHPEERELVDDDDYSGWLEAASTVEIRSRVRGHIYKIHFTDGEIVEQGQLLFELDPRPFQAEIDRAGEQIEVYRAQKVAAEKERIRLETLLTKGGASQSQVDQAQALVASLSAQIGAETVEMERRELDLEYSRITAPIAGRASRALLTEGNLVNAGGSDPLLTTIVSIDPIYAYFDIDERALQRYQTGDLGERARNSGTNTVKDAGISFSFGLDTDEGYPREGVLDFANNRVDPGTGTIQVRGAVDNEDGGLVPGSRIRVRVPVSAPYQAMLIPAFAVLTDQDRKYLLVVGKDNVVERRNVTLGRLLDDGMQVVLPGRESNDGVRPDDWVIVEGLQRARIHYPVDPVKPQ